MMAELRLAAVLCAAVLFGFVLLFRAMVRGKTGWALTMMSVFGAALVILLFMANRLDLQRAQTAVMIAGVFVLPAFIGGVAGGGLGWLIDRRRNRGP